jgi:hypothetical protein
MVTRVGGPPQHGSGSTPEGRNTGHLMLNSWIVSPDADAGIGMGQNTPSAEILLNGEN